MTPGTPQDGPSEVSYDAPGMPERPKGDTPYSSTGAPHWVCRGWTEFYSPDDAPHQWMHAYYEVREGAACGICRATEADDRRWDGQSNPFEDPSEAEQWADRP